MKDHTATLETSSTELSVPILAALCVGAAVAALAPRWMHGELTKIACGMVVTLALLVVFVATSRRTSLRRYRELAFAFFVFALVQVLNNSLPYYVGRHILHRPPTAHNPLASTTSASIIIQLLETAIAVVPIIVLTKAAGMSLDSIYVKVGRLGRRFVGALVAFGVFVLITLRHPQQHILKTHGQLSTGHIVSLLPALFVLAISNGIQEELLFRGLFLRKYSAFFSRRGANVLQASIFAIAHLGVTYSSGAVFFAIAVVFPLDLLFGFLMQTTDGIAVPTLIHAAGDLPIYLGFLAP
jgi:membrane protease YdiL (CAAX protease family)